MSHLVTERLIQRQLNHWNSLRAVLRRDKLQSEPTRGPVITVSRLAGSGGRRLARQLAERLDLELHDQSLVDRIARDSDLERAVVAQLDEKTVSRVHLWIQGALQQRIFLTDDYHTALVRVVTSLAARGGVVFLGRGANLILGERADLRVRVVASDRNRQERVRARRDLGRAEARVLLDQVDAQREDFVRRVFQTEPCQPRNFDLVLNADRLSTANMADHALLALAHGRRSTIRQSAAAV
ncbi:hypothetical protein DRQ50_00445 [bacterium]|nr:MAG: hypothetical protein DRQ50_00445 [bacterium]